MKRFIRNIALYLLPVLIVAVALMDEVLQSMDCCAICIDASEWDISEDGWYNATHLTQEESVEFTKQIQCYLTR